VTLVISFFTLVLGELAPKRLALQRAERVSLAAAPLLDRMSTLGPSPGLAAVESTNLVVRCSAVIRVPGAGDDGAGTSRPAGRNQSLSPDERHIVSEVFDAGKRQIREVLVPRTEVEFLPASMSLQEAAKIAVSAPYSRFPVYQDSYDDVIGFVHARDLLDPAASGSRLVGEVRRTVKLLPTTKTVLSALSEMRKDHAHLAIVVDEYGGTAGIVTLEDSCRGTDRRHPGRVRH